METDDVILYKDSTIAFAWINTPPNQLKTFIGNRVSKIQDLNKDCTWRHISSHLNPANIISRGTAPQELAKLTLWWHGPQMSQDDSLEIPVQNIDVSSDKLYLSELKNFTNCNLISIVDSSYLDNLHSVSNNFCKLIRIVAFIFRFFNNLRSTSRFLGPLTLKELQLSKLTLVKLVQATSFRVEIKSLEKEDIQGVKREIGKVKDEVQRKIEEVKREVQGKIEEEKGEVQRMIEEVKNKVQGRISDIEKRLNDLDLEIRPDNFPVSPEVMYSRPTVKSLTFDGKTSWTVFKTQFDVVSSANG
ncbi:hypothetical protein AVEN_29221-1 [Araneus ventricosus]|uniref:Uncharacterized protein n=1 Tax=Araneus ventricosus TaxID=182803 RepID=A0A4Y2E1M9_ARAVE|nr:hypothetical protein AVEN_29221-1 [Araneus ventricosus]